MFVPTPESFTRSDDDCAVSVWAHGRKMLVMYLNCYGTSTVRCGMRTPPGGSVLVDSFEEGWRWFCDDGELYLPRKKSESSDTESKYRVHAGILFEQRLGRLQSLLVHDGPMFLIADAFHMLFRAAEGWFGRLLYERVLKHSEKLNRQLQARCQHCDNFVSFDRMEPPVCETCDHRLEKELEDAGVPNDDGT